MNSTLSPTIVNRLILGGNFFKQTFNDQDTSFNPVAIGLNTGVTEPSLIGTPTLRIASFAGAGATQALGRIDTTKFFTENLSVSLGRHQLKFGGEYRYALLDVFYDLNKRGSFTWDGTRGPWANDASVSPALRSLADFLNRQPTNNNGASIVRGQLPRDFRQNSLDWWVHDNFQVNPRLNIDFGVRYTYQGPLFDKKDSITVFVPGKGLQTTGQLGSLYPKDWNNFAPRFGFAFQPQRNGKTVIRGSWGVFFDVPPLNFIVANTGSGNGGASGVHANPGGPEPVFSVNLNNQNVQIAPNVPIFGTAQPIPPFGVHSVSQDFRTPYIQNYNLNIQQQLTGSVLLQVGYAGSTGRKMAPTRNINAPIPGTTGTLASRRPFNAAYPNLQSINEIQSIGNSQYHSLQTSVRVTRFKNWTINGNYTYGTQKDNGTNVRNTLPANSYDLRPEYGFGNVDLRHIFAGFVSYEVPKFTQRRKYLTQGWQINSLMTYSPGEAIDIVAGVNRSQSFDNRDRVDYLKDPNMSVKAPTTAFGPRPYFDPTAFALPAIGSFGSLPRNVFRGPGFGAVDFSFFKFTPITERIGVQFRFEVFNLFNQSNWANPGVSLNTATTFGLITNTRNGGTAPGLGFGEPRNIQLALKIIF